MEAGYGLDEAELAARLVEAGAAGLNLEDTDHPNHPALVPADRHAARIVRIKESADLVLNARIDVHLRGGRTPEALERARSSASPVSASATSCTRRCSTRCAHGSWR